MASAHLALYKFDGCPYCQYVENAIGRLGLQIERRDIYGDPQNLRQLVEATGRRTVPCLRVEDASGNVRWMHESRDIVAYLEQRVS